MQNTRRAVTGLQQSEYGQRHFTGFLCCLHHAGCISTLAPEEETRS